MSVVVEVSIVGLGVLGADPELFGVTVAEHVGCVDHDGIVSSRRLVDAGMDVARLNFSHGDYDSHRQFTEWVRQAAHELGKPVAVLQDIQGPRIRVGTFPGGSVRSALR